MFTPIFRNKLHDVTFIFPKLYVDNKNYAMNVGKTVEKSARKDNFVDVEFTGEVADINELKKDLNNMRVMAQFDKETGEKEYILLIEPLEIIEELKV